MLEPLIRSQINRLQPIYDHAPSPARHLITSARGWFLTQIRYSARTLQCLEDLRGGEFCCAREIESNQLHALRQTIEHARLTTPFYSSYPGTPLRTLEDLRSLPVLSRSTVRALPEQFLSCSVPSEKRIRAGTTGTTGANLKVAYTEEFAGQNWAFLLRQWAWAGVTPREPRISFFGSRIVPASRTAPPFWTHNFPERQTLASIFHLSEKTAPAYLDFLCSQQGTILEGFPSVLGILADFAIERGQTIPMRVIFTSGEPLYAHLREKIERAFQARIFDSYGMTEYCGLIQECEHGGMHLIPEFGYLEILDENDAPVASSEEGYFVWTGFLNRAMPLLRYRIGDRGRWLGGAPCPCGRAFPMVVPTITRESDLLCCPDGRMFSPRALNQLLKQSSALRFCQFVHDQPARIIVRAVPGSPGAVAEVAEIRARLASLLGPGMRVTFEIVAAPIARPGGKIPLIVNQAAL